MKKQFFGLALSLCGAIGLLTACGQDEPVKPNDETKNKLHDTPFEATYTLTEATIATPEVFDGNPKPSDVTPTGQVQTLLYKATEERGWHIVDDSPSKNFKVKGQADAPNTVYILTIEYRNAEGKVMNHEFIDNGQDKIHQHFFTYYKGSLPVKKKDKLPYDYRYLDTTPWDDPKGQYTADKNPIGFRGLLRFSGEKDFMLNADLIHAFETKYEADGSINPFYLPSARLKSSSDQDVSVKLPFIIGDADSNASGSGAESSGSQGNGSADDKLAEGEYGKLNSTKVAKMVIKMYEGHLHKTSNPKVHNFHYVPGPIVPNPYMRMEQELVFLYKDGVWRSAEGTTYQTVEGKDEDGDPVIERGPKTLHLDRLFFKGSVTHDGLPAPIYGCWIEYYDASGRKLNGEFSTPGEYQHFFSLSDVEPLAKSSLASVQTLDLMDYIYKDTTPWDKSAAKQGAKYSDKPLGLKGYFNFSATGYKARLNIDLRKDGGASNFHTPAGGQSVLRVSVPIYVPYGKKELESFAVLDEDATWDDLTPEQKAIGDLLISALKMAGREELVKSFIYLYNGDRGNEALGAWF